MNQPFAPLVYDLTLQMQLVSLILLFCMSLTLLKLILVWWRCHWGSVNSIEAGWLFRQLVLGPPLLNGVVIFFVHCRKLKSI